MDLVKDFLRTEISYQDMYDEIMGFITSPHIRCGEFEANRYIIKKMDQINFIIFPEDIYQNGTRGIGQAIALYRNDLIKVINEYARTMEIVVIDFTE